MPENRIQPIQQSFAGGEITPRMSARSDTDGYHTSAAFMENWAPFAHGPITKRNGDEWMRSVTGDYGRIFDFYVSTNVGFAITITTDTVTVSDNSGTVLEPDETTNGDFIDGPLGWVVHTNAGGSNVIFSDGLCALDPGDGLTRYAGIHQQITGLNPAADLGVKITTESGLGDLLVEVGTTEGGDDIYTYLFTGEENIVITIPATGESDLWFSFTAPGGQPIKIIDKVEVVDFENMPGEISFPSPYPTPTDLERIQYDMPPGIDEMYFVCPNIAPQRLVYDKSARTWDFEVLPVLPPGDESFHVWEDGNWPYAITFGNGRMWLAGLNTFGEVF
ncbi:MAG: hypothetical protein KAS32_29070, partial [Candidatus Peribacteraceae bacterium]|nr:hypothetical protein [Candidatus Peribacteraceae bacterium]